MNFERFPNNRDTKREVFEKRLAPALALALVANASLAHENYSNLEDFEIPRSASWVEGISLAWERSVGQETEVPMDFFSFSDGATVWNVPRVKSVSEGTVLTGDLHDQVYEFVAQHQEELTEACIMHTHPGASNEFPYLPPSVGTPGATGDIIFLKDMRTQLRSIEGGGEIAEKMTHVVKAEEGLYYYNFLSQDKKDVIEQSRREEALRNFSSEQKELYNEVDVWVKERSRDLSEEEVVVLYKHLTFTGRLSLDGSQESVNLSEKRELIRAYFMENHVPTSRALIFYGNEEMQKNMDWYFKEREKFMYPKMPAFSKPQYNGSYNMFFDMSQAINGWRMDMGKEVREKNESERVVDMSRLRGIYREYGYDVRFVPEKFISQEPPCAGVEHDTEYVYDGGKWKMSSSHRKVE